MVLFEGVVLLVEFDMVWNEMFVKIGVFLCELMDLVGLDIVLFIE